MNPSIESSHYLTYAHEYVIISKETKASYNLRGELAEYISQDDVSDNRMEDLNFIASTEKPCLILITSDTWGITHGLHVYQLLNNKLICLDKENE